jgi:hypothetical protein
LLVGGDSSSWSYDAAILTASWDDALYLNGTALPDVTFFVGLAAANRQLMYGLTRLDCERGGGRDGARPVALHSFPVDPNTYSHAVADALNAADRNDSDADDGAGLDTDDLATAHEMRRSLLRQSAAMIWPLAGAGGAPFTWLHALSDESSAAHSYTAGGYQPLNRLQFAVLLGWTNPKGHRTDVLRADALDSCQLTFLSKEGNARAVARGAHTAHGMDHDDADDADDAYALPLPLCGAQSNCLIGGPHRC